MIEPRPAGDGQSEPVVALEQRPDADLAVSGGIDDAAGAGAAFFVDVQDAAIAERQGDGVRTDGRDCLCLLLAEAGEADLQALVIGKQGLAKTVCGNVTCSPATGGLITKGLTGYLGDNQDPLAKFDPTQAKQLLKEYDPTGQLTANLKYSYNAGSPNDQVATYLAEQWKANLGVSVTLNADPDASDFIKNRLAGGYVMSRDGWQFDYNSPQDWYDNLWGAAVLSAGANTSGFDDPQYDSILAQADQLPTTQALPLYNQLAKMLSDDAVYIPLYYSVGNFLIHSYVKGAGSNTAFDYYWDQISLLSH